MRSCAFARRSENCSGCATAPTTSQLSWSTSMRGVFTCGMSSSTSSEGTFVWRSSSARHEQLLGSWCRRERQRNAVREPRRQQGCHPTNVSGNPGETVRGAKHPTHGCERLAGARRGASYRWQLTSSRCPEWRN